MGHIADHLYQSMIAQVQRHTKSSVLDKWRQRMEHWEVLKRAFSPVWQHFLTIAIGCYPNYPVCCVWTKSL
jgi:membrane protein YqaA with SNARE-associated domain